MGKRFTMIKLAYIDTIAHDPLRSIIITSAQSEVPWLNVHDKLLYGITKSGSVIVFWLSHRINISHLEELVEYKHNEPGYNCKVWTTDNLEVNYPSYFIINIPDESDVIGITRKITINDVNKLLESSVGNSYLQILRDAEDRFNTFIK